eukprot:scaffold7052_cov254-Pinguiococcus_pyrenoidosus.AAC.129
MNVADSLLVSCLPWRRDVVTRFPLSLEEKEVSASEDCIAGHMLICYCHVLLSDAIRCFKRASKGICLSKMPSYLQSVRSDAGVWRYSPPPLPWDLGKEA